MLLRLEYISFSKETPKSNTPILIITRCNQMFEGTMESSKYFKPTNISNTMPLEHLKYWAYLDEKRIVKIRKLLKLNK